MSRPLTLLLATVLASGGLARGCSRGDSDVTTTRPKPDHNYDAPNTVTDIEGNVYGTVMIGTQTWMTENLRVTKDPRGGPIVSYCYDDDPGNCQEYGRLYTWDVAMHGSKVEQAQGISPDGWHIPSDAEWNELFDHLGGEKGASALLRLGGSTGFDALLGGGADFRGNYLYVNEHAMFWSSSEVSEERAYHHGVSHDGSCDKFAAMKGARIAIRCIKDKAEADEEPLR